MLPKSKRHSAVADPGISCRGGGGGHKIAWGEIYEKRWSEATDSVVSNLEIGQLESTGYQLIPISILNPVN